MVISESKIQSVVSKTIQKFLREEFGDNTRRIEDAEDTHFEIGFANKFYTLWRVSKKKYTTTYAYIKNISFSKDKVESLYPDAPFNDELKGKTRSFTVSIASKGTGDGIQTFGKPHVGVQEGQEVDITEFLVQDSRIKYTRYNKPYYSIVGIDCENPFESELVMNLFDKPRAVPKKGDVLHVTGVVGFFNEDKDLIYLNNTNFDFIENNNQSEDITGDGEKVKNMKVILSQIVSPEIGRNGYVEKNGYVVFTNENGEDFVVESCVGDFRTGRANRKFDTTDMVTGSEYELSGTVKKVNDYNKILRAKFNLVSMAEKNPTRTEHRVIKRANAKIKVKQGQEVLSNDSYTFGPDSIKDFIRYVWDTYYKFGRKEASLYVNTVIRIGEYYNPTFEEFVDRIYKDIYRYDEVGSSSGGILFVIDIPATNETISMELQMIFED